MMIQTEEKDFARDVTTRALINTNARALHAHKLKKEETLRIQKLEENMNSLMQTMEQILNMLKNNEGK